MQIVNPPWCRPGIWRALCAALATAAMLAAAPSRAAEPSPEAAITLTDQTGRTRTPADFRGKPSLVFFGFTSCPSICPTMLNDVAARMADIGALADRINFIFVSVDPEQDTPEIIKDYVAAFDARIIGLTGKPADLAALAKQIGATFQKVPQGDGYTIDHTAHAFLMDRDWRRTGILVLGPGTDEKRASAKLRALLGEAGH